MQNDYPRRQDGGAKNAFTMSPSVAQVVSYLTVFLQGSVYLTCLHNELPSESSQVAWSMTYCLLLSILLVSASLTSLIDPSDPVVLEYKAWVAHKNQSFESKGNYYYCTYCDSYCKADSKHCRQCDRCVQNFDHHCIWINNCIGSRNYREFMVMIISALLLMCEFIAATLYCTFWTGSPGYSGSSPKLVVAWTTACIAAFFAVLLLYLVCLHFYLISLGTTTFEFSRGTKLARRKNQSKNNQPSPQIQLTKPNKNNPEGQIEMVPEGPPEVFEVTNEQLANPGSPRPANSKLQTLEVKAQRPPDTS